MTINRPSPTSGFTLVELLVTLAVFAILLGLAVPSFTGTNASNRVTTATNDILTALTLARSEAIRRNQRVTACTSTDGATCATGSSWTQGWIVFVDRNHNATVDIGETLVRSGPAAGGDITIVGNANVDEYVSYAPDGTSKLTSGVIQVDGTLRICSSSAALTDDQRARDIVINAAGRAATTKPPGIASNCPAP